jgi:hypothetical protein
MPNKNVLTVVTPTRWLRSRHRPSALVWGMGMAVVLVLGHPAASLAGPLDDAAAKAAARFEPVAAFPPLLAGRLQDAAGPVYVAQVAGTPPGTVYATTDKAGKARVWLLRNNAVVADVTAPASRDTMLADWPGSFAFLVGGMPVIAISWKFGNDAYGIEDFAFWAAESSGRFLGGLPGSTRSPCSEGQSTPGKGCARCATASGIPINLRLAELQPDHARFVQQRAANWYYYYASAAEVFEQDYLLTAKGLVPDGPARSNRTLMPLPQAQERVQVLLRDYFRLAKTQSRQTIAPEFLTCFEQLVDLAPDFAKGHYNVGCMNALLGNRKQAVAAVSKALVIEPKYRKLARKDPDLDSIRDDPEFARALAEPAK